MTGTLPDGGRGAHGGILASGGAVSRTIASRPIGETGASTVSAPRVLIVDDHPTFRASARRLLEAEGFVVVGEAADGEAALAAAAALDPDLVLIDVQLPGLDGFETARRLTAAPGAPAVVLTSSRDWSEHGGLVLGSGARGFVSKADLCGAALTALVA